MSFLRHIDRITFLAAFPSAKIALKQIRIFTLTKELNPNISEAISYHSAAGYTDHIENRNSS